MFRKDTKKRYALIGGLFGTAYLAANHVLPGIPEFLLGLSLGVGMIFLALGLLPEEQLERLRKWKRRG